MTTSLTKSTIPVYDPDEKYTSPRLPPRVKYEGREIFEKHRGTFNIAEWAEQGKNWKSPPPTLKLKYEDAYNAYKRNTEGSMKELMTGYCANPPMTRTGPRVSKEAWENYRKNRGSFHTILGGDIGTAGAADSRPSSTAPPPRVFREGIANGEKNRRGELGSLFANYGRNEATAASSSGGGGGNELQPHRPRVKYGGEDNWGNHRGSELAKTLQMVPLTNRPTSAQFFNQKFN